MSIFIDKHELAEKRDIPYQNLLLGSHDFSGDWAISNGGTFSKNKIDATKDPNGNLAFLLDNLGPWKGIGQKLTFKKGEYVSCGAYVKVNADNDTGMLHSYMVTLDNSHLAELIILRINHEITTPLDNQGILQYLPNKATEWVWVESTFQVKEDGCYLARIENETNTPFEVSSMIVSKTTEDIVWKPNSKDFAYKSSYDDLNNRLTAIESQIQGGKA